MSIGLLKRLLALANVTAVLAICGAGYGFWSHKSSMDDTWKPPDFRPSTKSVAVGPIRINDITMQLGRFPEPRNSTPTETKDEPKKDLRTELAKLGEIKSAVVAYPPYDDVLPAIIFEFNTPPAGQKEKLKTIRVGEALLEKPDPDFPGYTIPVAYKFIRCEPDPENPGWTYFVFDMDCDGQDIQKARWKLEQDERSQLETAAAAESSETVRQVSDKGFSLLDPEARRRRAEEKRNPTPARPEQPTTVQPVEPTPKPTTFSGELFTQEPGGTYEPTKEGVEYLKENYNELLKDARTTTWRDPGTRRPSGIKITGIRPGSPIENFGLRRDDVILEIQGQKVSSKAEAIKVVKRELRKKPRPRIIRAKVLRLGETREVRFDTRDPDTIAAAKRHLR